MFVQVAINTSYIETQIAVASSFCLTDDYRYWTVALVRLVDDDRWDACICFWLVIACLTLDRVLAGQESQHPSLKTLLDQFLGPPWVWTFPLSI